MKRWPTKLVLPLVAIGGMGVLGCAAIVTQWIKEGWLTQWWRPHDPLATIVLCTSIGGVIGLVTWPWIEFCLSRKNLRLAFPLVYGTSLVVVVIFTLSVRTGLFGPLKTAIPAFVSVCCCSFVAKFILPSKSPTDPTRCCPNCNYDLQGDLDAGCPECGWQRASET